ncbi:MmgE/PrpD family protein [Nannocystis sp. SCPEA4]|uniref:MmgE/PrpD family protein n=1 Tax=Nannocystis sp. SCPEA4 TaxID=2996787 RepID=UPI002271EF5D|nr:MmgE/PrpD family protein [Nannocystis sp. SCPEA4]MCY1060876.1 MmgE/PrpD family protein [Nannocystis sp. SCPEA4]
MDRRPTKVCRLGEFVERATFADLSRNAREQLELRILDAVGCAIGAMGAGPPLRIRALVAELGGTPRCTLLGGGRTAPDRAALYNAALVRYLDYNDSYLAPGETCHPSDNLGAVLAAAEYAGADGRELLTAVAVAYQVQCRLSDEAPVRRRGFDHVTHLAYSAAAGAARALGLDAESAANAMAIAGTALVALRVTRTGALSHWKGLAAPYAASCALEAALLAMRGITGPAEVFEGNKGFEDAIAGPFEIDWSKEGLDRVERTIVKRYDAEVHSQSTLEGVLELKAMHAIDPATIERVTIDTFDVAYHIIGGGEEGGKTSIGTKEEADHSLPYMVAVALLDGQVLPAQYEPQRIRRGDVQRLLRRIFVRPDEGFSRRFPAEMPCRITISTADNRFHAIEKRDYEGFVTRPMSWAAVAAKFDELAAPHADETLRREIRNAVRGLKDRAPVAELARLLARVGVGSQPHESEE